MIEIMMKGDKKMLLRTAALVRTVGFFCAVAVCAGSRARALPPFDPSQQAQEAQDATRQTEKNLEKPFLFKIEIGKGTQPGAADLNRLPLMAIFPNQLRLVSTPAKNMVEIFFTGADADKKAQNKPIPLNNASLSWTNEAIIINIPGECEAIWPTGHVMLASICSAASYLDSKYQQPYFVDDLHMEHLPAEFWLIDNAGGELRGTVFSIEWQSYLHWGSAIRCYREGQKEIDEKARKAEAAKKTSEKDRAWRGAHEVSCAIRHQSVKIMETPSGYIMENGKFATPIIPLRWITDPNPKP